jgi:DNA helicase HerA-like ATPase
MGFWSKLFEKEEETKSEPSLDDLIGKEEEALIYKFHDENIPGTLDLGWYYSENKDQFQMAKIPQKDRATHLYIVGATGTGKTKFLEFLIQQDIEKGNGFGVIDPHGDLIEDIKGFLTIHYDPEAREISERLILIDPTDPAYTVTFNPLEKLPNVSVSEQAAELIGGFRKIWSDSWGVRMEDLMRNSLIALGESELTLVDLPHFLTSRDFRKSILEKVSHPVTRNYFQRFEAVTDRGQITWIEPVMNKINAFLSDDRIRQIFSSSKSTFSLREIMDQKKMLLIKLDKGRLKDSADLLGSLLMAKIQMAAFSRSDVPQSKRIPFYLYIDEFQNFATESFSVILSEARKYGLSLIMAHQTLAQIPEELRSLILGNTGIQVYFRLNRHDAQLLAKEAFRYSGYEVKSARLRSTKYWSLGEEWEHHTETLQDLPPRVCAAKHKIEGGIIPLSTVEIVLPWEEL